MKLREPFFFRPSPTFSLKQSYPTIFLWQETFERLRARGATAQEELQQLQARAVGQVDEARARIEPLLQSQQQFVVNAVQDLQTPVADPPAVGKLLLHTYLWSAVCLLALSVGQVVFDSNSS